MPRKLTPKQLIKKFPDLLKKNENENCLVDICCPECGNRSSFKIQMVAVIELFDNGTECHEDTEWDGSSYCECADCMHAGKVRNFTFKGLDAEIYQQRP
jgi:hypothetical protein